MMTSSFEILLRKVCDFCEDEFDETPCTIEECPVRGLRRRAPYEVPEMDARVRLVTRHLHLRYPENLEIEDLAQKVGLSVSHLGRLFRNQHGMSMSTYLRRIRLQKAATLLRSTVRRISEIGYETGWKDPAHFSKAFRKEYGTSPSEFREAERSED